MCVVSPISIRLCVCHGAEKPRTGCEEEIQSHDILYWEAESAPCEKCTARDSSCAQSTAGLSQPLPH